MTLLTTGIQPQAPKQQGLWQQGQQKRQGQQIHSVNPIWPMPDPTNSASLQPTGSVSPIQAPAQPVTTAEQPPTVTVNPIWPMPDQNTSAVLEPQPIQPKPIQQPQSNQQSRWWRGMPSNSEYENRYNQLGQGNQRDSMYARNQGQMQFSQKQWDAGSFTDWIFSRMAR